MSTNGHYPQLDPLDWDTIQPHVDTLLAAELDRASAVAWLQRWSNLNAVMQEAGARIYRAVTENTADEAAEQRFNRFVEVIMPQMRVAEQALKQKLLAAADLPSADDTTLLMRRFRTEAEIFRAENVAIESKLDLLGNQYNKIAGAMTIEWQGETITVPKANSLLEEPDRTTRKAVWRRMMDCFLAERGSLNDLYLEMLPLRRQLAVNAGYDSYRDIRWLQLARFDYTPEDCFTFHDAIETEVVPLASQIYRDLQSRLGIDAMRPWDVDADPYGQPLHPFSDVAELETGAQRIFDEVDPELGGYFRTMSTGYLDLASRANKAPGGYCNSFPVSGRPYIFMNAVGTHDNLTTLLHEGGHAFHFMESQRHQPLVWNQDGPMEFCEVASMSMELLSAPYLARDKGGFYSDAEARRAYADQLRKTVLFFPYMAVVDAFQHWVYAEAPHSVTAADMDRRWRELVSRFMPGVNWDGLQTEMETGWHRKGHIFEAPFYYIEYGLAQIGALQVWRNALADQSGAVAAYRSALALGYTRPLPALFTAAGARFAFDRATVGRLMALIQEQLAILDAQ
ncbi:MAG: M3 family oligoendopeptidase [Anaerolineae bacterium]|nr:M3 family oligoendopeptidase [Anaerolineae bacterium]